MPMCMATKLWLTRKHKHVYTFYVYLSYTLAHSYTVTHTHLSDIHISSEIRAHWYRCFAEYITHVRTHRHDDGSQAHFTCLSLINSCLSSLCPLSCCKYVLASILLSCCPTVTRFHGALCISTMTKSMYPHSPRNYPSLWRPLVTGDWNQPS